jgi:hypothetical protein
MKGFGTCLGVFMAVGFFTIVGAIVWYAVASARRSRRTYFEAAARRLKGEYLPSGFMTHDRIEFPLDDRKALAEFVSPGEDDWGRTRILVPLNGRSPGLLHIIPEGFAQSFLKMFGAQDLEIGDRAFDAAYVVKAAPESLAAQVFSPERRGRVIETVKRLAGLPQATIQLTRDHLRVQAREELRNEARLMQLVDTAKEFLTYLEVQPPPAGIELEELRTSTGTLCPVCGTALGDLVVRCESCKSPHHAECWKYVGQCSTYACKGKRSVP